MPESRRERKKRETRRRIADAAIALFLDQGYDRTTVVQIAAAADVDPKTFFNYFGSKDEVLLASSVDADDGVLVAALRDRRPDEGPGELLGRLVDSYDAYALAVLPSPREPAELAAISRLILTTPTLQAKLLTLLDDLQRRLADALLREFPDRLDPVTAAAVTGSLTGAMYHAALVSIRAGHSRDDTRRAVRRARDVALHGLRSVDHPDP